MPLSPQAERAKEIFEQITELEQELNDLVSPPEEVPKRKKWTRRNKMTEVSADDITVSSDPVLDEAMRPRQKGAKSCCGSRGTRHFRKCPVARDKKEQIISSPIKADDENPPEEELRCGECEHRFIGVLLDAVCNKCGSNSIYRSYD